MQRICGLRKKQAQKFRFCLQKMYDKYEFRRIHMALDEPSAFSCAVDEFIVIG